MSMASDRLTCAAVIVLDEANSIGDDLPPGRLSAEAASSQIRELLREYVPLRIVTDAKAVDLQADIARSSEILAQVWTISEGWTTDPRVTSSRSTSTRSTRRSTCTRPGSPPVSTRCSPPSRSEHGPHDQQQEDGLGDARVETGGDPGLVQVDRLVERVEVERDEVPWSVVRATSSAIAQTWVKDLRGTRDVRLEVDSLASVTTSAGARTRGAARGSGSTPVPADSPPAGRSSRSSSPRQGRSRGACRTGPTPCSS